MRIHDETRDELGHIPFTQSAFTALGLATARRCCALLLGPAKVIVVDCDNTLWGGVCGEDGPAHVRVDGPYAAFQRFLVAQQAAGKLLCLCSKNNLDDVMATFAAHPDMALRLEHVAAHRINWLPKSEKHPARWRTSSILASTVSSSSTITQWNARKSPRRCRMSR